MQKNRFFVGARGEHGTETTSGTKKENVFEKNVFKFFCFFFCRCSSDEHGTERANRYLKKNIIIGKIVFKNQTFFIQQRTENSYRKGTQ